MPGPNRRPPQRRNAFDILEEMHRQEAQDAADLLLGRQPGEQMDPLDDLAERSLAAELLRGRLGGQYASEPMVDAGAAGRDPSVIAERDPYDPQLAPRPVRRVQMDAPVHIRGQVEMPPGGVPDAGPMPESPPLPVAPATSTASGMTPAQEEAFLREEAASQDWANQTFGQTQAPGTGGVEAGQAPAAGPGTPGASAAAQDRTIAMPGYPEFTVPPGQEATATARIPVGGGGRGAAFPSPQAAQEAFLSQLMARDRPVPLAAGGAPGAPDDAGAVEGQDRLNAMAPARPELDIAQENADIEARMLDTGRQLDVEDQAEAQARQQKEVMARQEEEHYQRTMAEVETRRVLNEHQQLVNQVRSMRADPNRFFSSRTGPGMFGAAMALALADVTPGRGAALIESLIQQDLQAQEVDLQHANVSVGASENLLGAMRAVHRDEETARLAAREAMLERFRLEAEQLDMRQQGTDMGQRARVAAAQVQEQQAALRATIAQRNFAAYLEQARRAASGGRRPMNLQVRVENPSQGQNRVPGAIQERIAAGEASAQGLRALARRIREHGAGAFQGSRATRYGRELQEEFARQHIQVSNAMAGLQMTEHEMGAIRAGMADPTSFLERLARSDAEMANSLDQAANVLTAKAHQLAQMNNVPSPQMDAANAETDVGAMTGEDLGAEE